MKNQWLGIDIGGANLKIATEKVCQSERFELWRRQTELREKLAVIRAQFPQHSRWAVTMTGELADCFISRRQGVDRIVDDVEWATGDQSSVYYQTSGQFCGAKLARQNWELTAASNWHAMAQYVACQIPDCLVVDIGSTTTDIIPIANGAILSKGRTDLQRLCERTLLYVGAERTPICSMISSVQFREKMVPIANEFFACVEDVYLVTGSVPERESTCGTVDGRAANRQSAHRRIAKMICLDGEQIGESDMLMIAEQIAAQHQKKIAAAIEEVRKSFPKIHNYVILGSAAWLAELVLLRIGATNDQIVRLEHLIGWQAEQDLSAVGPAYAVMKLASRIRQH